MSYRISTLLTSNKEIVVTARGIETDEEAATAVAGIVDTAMEAQSDDENQDGWIVLGERVRVRADQIIAVWWDDEGDDKDWGSSLN